MERFKITFMQGNKLETLCIDLNHLKLNREYYKSILKNSIDKKVYEISISNDKGKNYKDAQLIDIMRFFEALNYELKIGQKTLERVNNFLK